MYTHPQNLTCAHLHVLSSNPIYLFALGYHSCDFSASKQWLVVFSGAIRKGYFSQKCTCLHLYLFWGGSHFLYLCAWTCMKNLSHERVQAGKTGKFSQCPGIPGLPAVLDRAAVRVWYEHTLPPVKQKESKGKRLQQNCLQLCPSNWKETTSSFYVNPSLRKNLMTNPPIYLRALKRAKGFYKTVVKQVSSWQRSVRFQIILCLYWSGIRH